MRDRELFLAEPHIAASSVSAGPGGGPPLVFQVHDPQGQDHQRRPLTRGHARKVTVVGGKGACFVAGIQAHEPVVRVDGDIAEIFSKGAFSHRLLLAWLAVQGQPSIRGMLVVKITSASADMPLYEVLPKARPVRGSTVEVVIKTEEEPLYREFFGRVGQLCGRPVAP